MAKSTSGDRRKKYEKYLENTKYNPVSNSLWMAVALLNKYDKRALDLGCGALKDSKFLINCGFIVDAVDKEAAVKLLAKDLIMLKPKGAINVIIADYNEHDLGKDKYLIVNAQNTLSFNDEKNIKQLIDKIHKALKKKGLFVGSLFGPKDYWAKKRKEKMSFYNSRQAKQLLTHFEILEIWESESDRKTALGTEKHWHVIDFIAKKT